MNADQRDDRIEKAQDLVAILDDNAETYHEANKANMMLHLQAEKAFLTRLKDKHVGKLVELGVLNKEWTNPIENRRQRNLGTTEQETHESWRQAIEGTGHDYYTPFSTDYRGGGLHQESESWQIGVRNGVNIERGGKTAFVVLNCLSISSKLCLAPWQEMLFIRKCVDLLQFELCVGYMDSDKFSYFNIRIRKASPYSTGYQEEPGSQAQEAAVDGGGAAANQAEGAAVAQVEEQEL